MMEAAEGLRAIFAAMPPPPRAQAVHEGDSVWRSMPPDGHGSPDYRRWHRRESMPKILRKAVKGAFDILLAGGQDHLKGKVFGLATSVSSCDRDLLTAVAAIEATVAALGLANGTAGLRGWPAAAVELAKRLDTRGGGFKFRVRTKRPV